VFIYAVDDQNAHSSMGIPGTCLYMNQFRAIKQRAILRSNV